MTTIMNNILNKWVDKKVPLLDPIVQFPMLYVMIIFLQTRLRAKNDERFPNE